MNALAAGDKVTTLLSVTDCDTGDTATYVVHTTVVTAFMAGGFRWEHGTARLLPGSTITVNGRYDRLFADEHLTWLRGWPEWDSPEVRALLVADGMGPGAVPETLFAEDTSPGYSSAWRYDLDRYLDDDFEPRGLVR